MTERTRNRLAWGVAGASFALTIVYVTYSNLRRNPESELGLTVITLLAVTAYCLVGATIASRTGNAVGWALLAVVSAWSFVVVTDAYGNYAYEPGMAGATPALVSFLVSQLAFFLTLMLVVAVPLLYPTGVPRWRWVWRTYVAAMAVLLACFAILPADLGPSGEEPGSNPFAVDAGQGIVGVIAGAAGLAVLLCAGAAVVSLILRYRESRGDQRQQVRWLAYLGIATIVALIVMVAVIESFGESSIVADIASYAFFAIVFVGIPVTCGVAILKYHLYELDIVVRKTVVFTLVAATLTVLYLAVLALATVGNVSRLLVGVILLVVTFRPVQRAARAVADRMVYGRRASAYEVLSEFSGRVGDTYATEDVLPRMAQILASGTGAASARVLLRLGGELQRVAQWPTDAPVGVDDHVEPVVHQGEELGALAVSMPANDPMDPARERLVVDLASQAGLVLRNVRLIEELRASRQRLVAAQDEERRKIERNLHDGVQQQLVALNVQLGLLARVASTDVEKAGELATSLQGRATEALDDLRDLARGIYPPLLADKGLATALEAQARKAAVPTTVIGDEIGRYPQDVEAAVYFCALEALNNVAKYAHATSAAIELSHDDGHLRFQVRDDGEGFDTSSRAYGTGLQGMADRLDAIGGTLQVTSTPGAGTTVTGQLPDPRGSDGV